MKGVRDSFHLLPRSCVLILMQQTFSFHAFNIFFHVYRIYWKFLFQVFFMFNSQASIIDISFNTLFYVALSKMIKLMAQSSETLNYTSEHGVPHTTSIHQCHHRKNLHWIYLEHLQYLIDTNAQVMVCERACIIIAVKFSFLASC